MLSLSHPWLLAAAVLLLLHRVGRRLYTAYLAEEPELYYLPTGLNRARPAERRSVSRTAARVARRRAAPPARASRHQAARGWLRGCAAVSSRLALTLRLAPAARSRLPRARLPAPAVLPPHALGARILRADVCRVRAALPLFPEARNLTPAPRSYAMRPAPAVRYRREMVAMADGGQVTLDWAPSPGADAALDTLPPGADDDAPIVLLMHGLAGASNENYIRSFAARAGTTRRWRVVVYNRRGHGDGEHIMPRLTLGEAAAAEGREHTPRADAGSDWAFGSAGSGGLKRVASAGGLRRTGSVGEGLSGAGRNDGAAASSKRTWPRHGDTNDLHAVVAHLRARHPAAPLLCIGYSAGSNVLIKYLAEAGSDAPVAGAVSVSNAYDLVRGTALFAKHHPWWDWLMARSLAALAARHWDMLEQVMPLPKGLVRKASSVRDLDALVAAPLYGYPSVDAYYADQHCCAMLEHVAAPTLCMNARDDPIIHDSLLDYPVNAAAANANLLLAVTKRGGHLGWVEGWRPVSWYETLCMQFLDATLVAHEARGGGGMGAMGSSPMAAAGAEAGCGVQPPAETVWLSTPPHANGRVGAVPRGRRAAAAREEAGVSPSPTRSTRKGGRRVNGAASPSPARRSARA